MAIVQMQSAATVNERGEFQLLPPVLNYGPAEKIVRPGIHLRGHLFGHLQEKRIPPYGQFQAALVIQRH